MSKKLQNQIKSKLDKLQKLLDNITDAQVINCDDPDTLYDLTQNLKEVLKLLEDQKFTKKEESYNNNHQQTFSY